MPEAQEATQPGSWGGEVFSSIASLVGTCVTALSMIVAAKLRFAQADSRRATHARAARHKAMPRRAEEESFLRRRFGRKARTSVPDAQRRHRRLLACFAGKQRRRR